MSQLSKIRAKIKKFFATSTYQKLAGLALLLITAVSIPLTIIVLNSSTDYQQHADSISRCGANKIGFCTYRPNMEVGAHCPSNTHSISAPPGDCYPLGGALAGLGTVFRAGNDYMCCAANTQTNTAPITCTCNQQFGLAAYHGGKSPYNHYSCSDGTSGYCGRDEVCGTYTYKPTKPCYTACFKDSDCSHGQSCALGIHQCVTATAGAVPVNDTSDACANTHCGNGKYCGGACGNTGNSNTLYDCENKKTASSTSCSSGCQINSSGPDYCKGGGNSDTSSNTTSQTKLVVDRSECEAVNFGACQFKVPYHLAHVTEDSNGNWTCTDLGYSASCDPNAKQSTSSNPTPTPTITPTPTPAGDIVLNVAVKLMGIGLRGNLHPRHQQRRIHIQIYKATDDPSQPNISPVLDIPQVVVTYNATSGYFVNNHIDLGKKFVSGDYQILVKSPGYLRAEILDAQGNKVFTLSAGQVNTFPTIALIGGDTNALYNVMDISDFYALVGCYKDKASSSTCTNKDLADLNDDGVVDGVDLNYWLDAMATLQTENKNGGGDGVPGN